ncbi:MAG TPA: class I adenylate-forming enzyme family protein [Vicinamibacteria bacterium]|nr:class I adenylate-forming enzyme family protein [Vicinamibacteria bacterium]
MRSPFLTDWLFEHAEHHPQAPAVATAAMRLTYRHLADRVRTLAGHLAASGLGPGDRVLVALAHTPATVVASLAVQQLGATPVEVSREWPAAVQTGIAEQARVRAAFVCGRDARTWGAVHAARAFDRLWLVHGGALPAPLVEALRGAPHQLVLEDGRLDPSLDPPPPAPSPALAPDAPALILYTSGSTGRPRGVVQTWRNIDANTRSIVQYLGLGPQDRALLVLPLHYCYGRSVLQTHLFVGGSVFLDNRFAFPRVVLEALGTEGCTGFAGVPLTFEIIRRQVDVQSLSLPRLRYLTQAGGAMAVETADWVREAFRPAELFVMYGQTEATARLSYLPPEFGADKKGSIGIPIPGVTLRVVDDDGNPLPPGETGHLVARGENVTLGYLDEPEETAAILREGWLWTGDLATRDADGFLFHRGRSKEILKIGGHRVSPGEIEQVIARHPEVAEVAVIGVAEELKGEVAAAFVVGRGGRAPAEADLQRFCREHLPAYMVPATITAVEALPRNEAGKLLRGELASRGPGARGASEVPGARSADAPGQQA